MADTSSAPTPPSKATAATRKTMAPAGRAPDGAEGEAVDRGSWLNRSLRSVSTDDLQTLRGRIDAELRRPERVVGEPSFGISEGTRVELEQREELRKRNPEAAARQVVQSPFSGAELDADGEPVGPSRESDNAGQSPASS